MAHHKRKGPKSTRAGCLLCKPHKRQGAPKKTCRKFSDLRKIRSADDKLAVALKKGSLQRVTCWSKLEMRVCQQNRNATAAG